MNRLDETRGRVVVVESGLSNIASMMAGLRRVGIDPLVSDRPEDMVEAAGIVLPGVGRFDAGARSWRSRGLDRAIRSFCGSGRPVLAVCLGMQLLGAGSEETPGVDGLGVIDATVRRLPPGRTRPHLGWNLVIPDTDSRIVTDRGAAHFANGFAYREVPSGWRAAWSDDGGRFIAALERDSVLACQFHPEVSGSFGTRLLARWASLVREEVAACFSPA